MKFQIKRKNLGLEIKAINIVASLTIPGLSNKMIAYKFADMIACTEAVEPTEAEAQLDIVKDMVNFWSIKDSLSADDLWLRFSSLDYEIYEAWTKAFDTVHAPMIPVHQLNGSMVPADQRQEVSDPASPLAVSG